MGLAVQAVIRTNRTNRTMFAVFACSERGRTNRTNEHMSIGHVRFALALGVRGSPTPTVPQWNATVDFHCGKTASNGLPTLNDLLTYPGVIHLSADERTDTAMRGIETAFWGVLGKDPELRTSKSGKPFATMNVVVTVGTADNGKDVGQWLRVACFGEAAEKIAARAEKGDRVYVEGTLTLNTWADKATGEAKTGLNVAAWKCERMSAIGRSRPRDGYMAEERADLMG